MEEKKQTRKEKQLEKHLEAVVEAVLFTMGKSVELRQLAIATGQSEEETRQAVERLKARYDKEERGMEIIELEDSYQMCTRTGFYENLIRVAATPKKQILTDVVLETLSIIAYKQPITKLEIEKIRGVKSDHAVNKLIEYNLVYEVGRLDVPGRSGIVCDDGGIFAPVWSRIDERTAGTGTGTNRRVPHGGGGRAEV